MWKVFNDSWFILLKIYFVVWMVYLTVHSFVVYILVVFSHSEYPDCGSWIAFCCVYSARDRISVAMQSVQEDSLHYTLYKARAYVYRVINAIEKLDPPTKAKGTMSMEEDGVDRIRPATMNWHNKWTFYMFKLTVLVNISHMIINYHHMYEGSINLFLKLYTSIARMVSVWLLKSK